MPWTHEELLAALRIRQIKMRTLEEAYSVLADCLAEVATALEGDYTEHTDWDGFATTYLAKYNTAVTELQAALTAMG